MAIFTGPYTLSGPVFMPVRRSSALKLWRAALSYGLGKMAYRETAENMIWCVGAAGISDQAVALATALRILANHHWPRATRVSRFRP